MRVLKVGMGDGVTDRDRGIGRLSVKGVGVGEKIEGESLWWLPSICGAGSRVRWISDHKTQPGSVVECDLQVLLCNRDGRYSPRR